MRYTVSETISILERESILPGVRDNLIRHLDDYITLQIKYEQLERGTILLHRSIELSAESLDIDLMKDVS